MLTLYKPEVSDLWFKEKMLSDDATMAYNRRWGGTLPFPPERWEAWHKIWIGIQRKDRFYRYLTQRDGRFVGEVAYRRDGETGQYLADVIIYAPYRRRGYGREGLARLCRAAKENGILALHDRIARDNGAIALFLDCGFTEVCRTEEYVTVKKLL